MTSSFSRRCLLSRLLLVSLLASLVRSSCALRVAFVADSGIGNENPGDYWIDHWGNERAPRYLVGGEPCLDFSGAPCRGTSRARDVIAAVKDNGADLVVHAGDLDYESSPRSWRRFVDETIVGAGMDFLAVKGNHDADGWDGVRELWSGEQDGYAAALRGTVPSSASCRGSYGEDFVCDFPSAGLTLVLSSVGVEAAGERANEAKVAFIDAALRESTTRWKICVWHMVQAEVQVSYKGDSTGWAAYETCRKHGAFIVTGHAHAYSRTREIERFAQKRWNHHDKDIRVSSEGAKDARVVRLSPARASESATGVDDGGRTGVAVVGFSGYKNEQQLRGGAHWAKIYSSQCIRDDASCVTAPWEERFGALMCDLRDNDGSAECWTITTLGNNATRREKRRTYRNPVDRFFLVTSKAPRRNVTRVVPSTVEAPNRHIFTGNLDREAYACSDLAPPSHGCAKQKAWGKCAAQFMIDGGFCAKTCGRCVPPPLRDSALDYDDYADAPESSEPAE